MVLVVLTNSPYGSDKVYNGLRLTAALSEKSEVSLFLMCDAVATAVAGHSGSSDDTNLARRLDALVAKGVVVKVCGLCLETRGLHNASLVDGVAVGSMPELAGWVLESEQSVWL